MRRKHNELAIGITVTVATLIVVMSILLLGKSSVITVGMRVDMIVQNANGLGAGDQVFFRGIPVGTVQDVRLEKDGVLAALKLNGNPSIPVDSRFVIKEASLLGGMSVEIEPGSSSDMLAAGSRVTGQAQGGILSMAEGSSNVKEQVTQILSNINSLSGQQTTKNIYATLASLNALTQSLQAIVDENKQALAATVSNLQQVSSNANTTAANLNQIAVQNKEPIHQAVSSMNVTIVQLQAVIKETNSTVERLNTILTRLQDGRGSLGQLMVDDSLYREMQSTLVQIDALVKDIKKNPKKYVTFKLF